MAGFYAQTIYVGPTTSVTQYLYDTTSGGAGPFIVANMLRDVTGDIVGVTAGGGLNVDILSVGGTAVGATSYLPVRLTDGSVYITNLAVNQTQIGGVSVSVGAGVVGTGVQRMTLASDDPAVVSLAAIDDWDSQDQCKITINYKSAAVAPTTGGANYVSGDVVGGIQTITTANLASGRPIIIRQIQVNDKDGNAIALNLYFFKATPSGGTYTDNSALAWGSGDSANKVGQVSILAADWLTNNSQSSVSITPEMPITLDGTSLFLLIVAVGSATFTNGNLTLNLLIDQR